MLRKSFDETTKMAFSNEKATDLYHKRIYKFDRFEPRKNSKLFNNWREDYGDLQFDVHIPFEQQNSRFVNKTRPCVQAKELPLFYQLKGKIN